MITFSPEKSVRFLCARVVSALLSSFPDERKMSEIEWDKEKMMIR